MPAILRETFIGRTKVSIPDEKYESIKESRDFLLCIHKIEKLFTIFCEAYRDIELYLLSAPLDDLLDRPHLRTEKGVATFFETHSEKTNLKLLTLVNAFQAYIDQSKHVLTDANRLDLRDKLSGLLSNCFDNSLEYRILCGLRNYSTHRSLAIKRNPFCKMNEWENPREPASGASRGRFTINPAIRIRDLLADDKFREKTKAELRGLGKEYLDLKAVLRAGVATFSRAHSKFAENTDEELQSAAEVISDAYSIVTHHKNGEKAVNLELAKNEKSDGMFLDPLLYEFIEDNRKRWQGIRYVDRLYVSGEIVHAEDTWLGDTQRIYVPR